MLIIDTHVHVGEDRILNIAQSEDELIRAMDANQIDVAIVQPFPGDPNLPRAHDRIAAMAQKQSGRIWGLASLNPHMDPDEYQREMERCIKDLGFVALKCHPVAHVVMPLTAASDLIYTTAHSLGVPVMVHTGMSINAAGPAVVIPYALRYPDLPIVIAHSGFALQAFDAMAVAMAFKNVWLETSWTPVTSLRRMIKTLGSERIMFGTDSILNMPVEITRYCSLDLDEKELRQVFHQTAIDLFKLPLTGA
ncbi:MAG: amidohydrolase family protein [Ardenticatenaceae bacterium]|nr:amidohydrolase family protein [Ardenticatenaceae bacterium]HBY96662.1 metal-dependent hydrolase [Chloroflexota bacterium]